MLETFHPRQSMIRKSGYRVSDRIVLKQKRVEQIAVTGARSSEIGGNPGVFQLNAEGIHDACFHV
jgi:hypothetical protein